ncbi:MAG TPA: arylamine N-acetyltransferase [Thermoanaerobaculia bacterium]|nr:arylamine N-acetyltransferase [Thermoanaerobaculia bacterium]
MNADEILEALALERRRPDLASLRDLFDAFNRAVPFESASKIARDAEVPSIADKLRVTELFWSDHLELGTGGTCFARVAAFAALAEALGFRPAKILGGIMGPRNHASVLFDIDGRTWLADPGYPLPSLLPLESASLDTPVGSLEFAVSGKAAVLRFVSGPEYGRVIDFAFDPVSEEEFRAAWEKTFVRTSLFLREVVVRKPDGHRVLRFFRGAVDVSDAHSRTRLPLLGGRAAKLSSLFGIDAGLLARALSITGDRAPERTTARVEAYAEGPESEARFRALSTPGGYRRFLAGLGSVEIEGAEEGRWRAVVRPESGETVAEDVEASGDLLRIRRAGGLAESGFELDRSAGEPRLVRFAELPDAREEFLRVDAGRGRIAGMLAMDLLALSRL